MAKLNPVTARVMSQFQQNHHLLSQHPISRNVLKIRTIGKALTELEWERFKAKFLIPKLREFAERKQDGKGSVIFCGPLGLEAALILQEKFPGRFHFSVHCDTEQQVRIAIASAVSMGLDITEAHYMNGLNEVVNITDKRFIDVLASS